MPIARNRMLQCQTLGLCNDNRLKVRGLHGNSDWPAVPRLEGLLRRGNCLFKHINFGGVVLVGG